MLCNMLAINTFTFSFSLTQIQESLAFQTDKTLDIGDMHAIFLQAMFYRETIIVFIHEYCR